MLFHSLNYFRVTARLFVVVCLSLLSTKVDASTTIKHLQTMLNELDFKAGSADGIAGKNTTKALQSFYAESSISGPSNQFRSLEAVYDQYRLKTGKTVFDIYESSAFGLDRNINTFPETHFGDLNKIQGISKSEGGFWQNHCQVNTSPDQIGILLGFLKSDDRRDFQTVATNQKDFSKNGMTARGTYTKYVQTRAMDVLINNEASSKKQLLELFMNYAKADAFRWYSGSTNYNVLYNDTYGLKTVLTPTLAAWSILSADRDIISSRNGDIINDWIWRVLNRVDYVHGNQPEQQGNRNNQRYMLAVNLMQIGLLYRSEYFVHRAIYEATKVGSHMNNDGSLPLELTRGSRSLQYTGHASVSLMALAELASTIGYDLYENDQVKVKNFMSFYFSALHDPSIIKSYTKVSQKALKDWRYGSISPYCIRHPDADHCLVNQKYNVITPFKRKHHDRNMGYDAMINQCVNWLMWEAGSFD